MELSEITQDGLDVHRSRSFSYLKPRLDLRHTLSPADQLRFKVERTVSQLNFQDFVPRFDFLDRRVHAGNPELRPETAWEYEVRYEHRLAQDRGTIKGRIFYLDLQDVIERIAIDPEGGGTFISASGNIGDGKRYGSESYRETRDRRYTASVRAEFRLYVLNFRIGATRTEQPKMTRRKLWRQAPLWLLPLASMALAACTTTSAQKESAPAATAKQADAYPSTYQSAPSTATLIRGATVLTGSGARIDNGDVLMVDGRIEAVGQNLPAPAQARIIDASGRWVTPGLIDVHSHLGVYPSPSINAHNDGNEMTDPVSAHAWAEHAVWPQDPGFQAALEGGVTTLQILPGSGNLIGGRGVTLKNVAATTYQAMKFPDAPQGLKMACGENPKRVYGGQGRAPMTRMGNVAGYRQAFADAQDYRESLQKYQRELQEYEKKSKEPNKEDEKAQPPTPPKRDVKLETLVAAMAGELQVHVHCYRADEMAIMLDLAREFGFEIAAFHHAVEFYKIADRLAEAGICGAEWADWWGAKMELYDGIQENIALTDRPTGGCAIVHSDSEEGIQRLNQEAAKAMSRGVRAGLDIPPERAVRWITSNPARALGIADRTGSLEAGKMADVVIWSGTPFSVYALAEQVFIDGALVYDRANPRAKPRSDFMLGQPGTEAHR